MRSKIRENRRTLVAVFILLIILAETGVYVALTPRPQEEFFQLYVLGRNRLAGDYYPLNNPNLRVGSNMSWYVGVTNFMGTVQLVEIRLRLGNETATTPNDTTGTPSSAFELLAYDRALMDNETWELPFAWSIANATKTADSTRIAIVQINNQLYQLSDWSAVNGYNFRLILELWVWQTNTNTFEYGWSNGVERRTAWLQIWFNMTNAGPISQ
jgi:hypothetical protein